MVRARLHIICGNCGANDQFKYKIDLNGNCDSEGKEYPAVYIICNNCGTLHSLDSTMVEETPTSSAGSIDE